MKKEEKQTFPSAHLFLTPSILRTLSILRNTLHRPSNRNGGKCRPMKSKLSDLAAVHRKHEKKTQVSG